MTDVDDGRQTDGRRLAPTRPSAPADLDHLRRPLGLVDDPSTPPRRERPQVQNSSRPAATPEPLTTTLTQQPGSVRRRLARRRPLQPNTLLQSYVRSQESLRRRETQATLTFTSNQIAAAIEYLQSNLHSRPIEPAIRLLRRRSRGQRRTD